VICYPVAANPLPVSVLIIFDGVHMMHESTVSYIAALFRLDVEALKATNGDGWETFIARRDWSLGRAPANGDLTHLDLHLLIKVRRAA
jgi:hypothetical protein